MTDNMIDRVEKVLHDYYGLDFVAVGDECNFESVAIAAIKAMREPTNDMLDAGGGCCGAVWMRI